MPFRIKAFLTHLAVSCTVAAAIVLLVFMVWHPNPLQKAVGVTDIFLLLLGVDLILGPILTLLVAKQGKKSLKTDLAVIATVQIAAMLYGLHSIALSRPVWLAFDTGRFEVVQNNTLYGGDNALPAFRSPPLFTPQWVAVRPYETAAEQERRMKLEFGEGIAPSMQPDLYEDWQQQKNQMFAKAFHKEALNRYNPAQQVQTVLADYPQADKWLPLKAPAQDMTVLLDSKRQEIVKIVDLRPW